MILHSRRAAQMRGIAGFADVRVRIITRVLEMCGAIEIRDRSHDDL